MQAEPANPFRPGAGHMPLYLAGREEEKNEFRKLLKQSVILNNLVLTGLRGVGKTVLLDTLKPIAINDGWLWVGTDLTEATSLSEQNIAVRLIADLSVVTSGIELGRHETRRIGFLAATEADATGEPQTLTFEVLSSIYNHTPGLVADKLKATLERAGSTSRRKWDPKV